MRRAFLLGALLSLLALPAAAAPPPGAALQAAFPVPEPGNATLVQVQIPLRGNTARAGRVGIRTQLVSRLAGRYRLTQAATRRGNDLRVSLVLAHVLDTAGAVANAPYSFDSSVFAVGPGGAGAAPARGEAGVKLYLFDQQTGRPLAGDGENVCTPQACRFSLPAGTKIRQTAAENILTPHTPNRAACLGFGLITIRGGGDTVNVHSFITNARSEPFALSVFGFEPGVPASDFAAALNTGAADAACNKRSERAQDFLQYVRHDAGKLDVSLALDSAIGHGAGRSNVCVRVRANGLKSRTSGTVRLQGAGSDATKPVAVAPGTPAVVVFPISSYGQYTATANVAGKTQQLPIPVGPAGGGPFPCQAP